MKVDADSGWPLEAQIAQLLRDRIHTGELGPGDPLPSDKDLVAEQRVSRDSAARALRILVDEGLVIRRRGTVSRVADEPLPHIVRIGPGTVISVRIPLAGQRAATGAGKWVPLISVSQPGQDPVLYPADRTVIEVAGS